MKLGKRPAAPRASDFKLSRYTAPLPLPGARFGNGLLYQDWRLLGNDDVGDCVFAGAAHETMLWNKLASHPAEFTRDVVLSDYSAVTGYDPSDPSTDQGTDVHDAMSYRRRTGLIDGKGVRHKLDAYVSIDPKDWNTMLKAVWAFGAVGIGFNFPASAMDQFDRGETWDVVPGSPIEGGHYVPAVGSMKPTDEVSVVTWGKRQRMTRAFYEEYNDEAWCPLSLEVLRGGIGLHHLDVATLRSDLAAL